MSDQVQDWTAFDARQDELLQVAFAGCYHAMPSGKVVQIATAADVPALERHLASAEPKACFDNTFGQVLYLNTLYRNGSARYVLGRLYWEDVPVPIEHAFLWFEGEYYDLTLEAQGLLDRHVHFAKVEYDRSALAQHVREFGYPPMYEHWVRQQLAAN